jgi:hypothetical protein
VATSDERLEQRDDLERLTEARVVGQQPAAVQNRPEEPAHALLLVRLEHLRADRGAGIQAAVSEQAMARTRLTRARGGLMNGMAPHGGGLVSGMGGMTPHRGGGS